MNTKQNRARAGMLAGVTAGHAQARIDKRLALALNAEPAQEVAMMPLDKVLGRPAGDSRALDDEHLEALAESINALGLIEPLPVDRLGCLLCGAHRLLALRRLAVKDPERWRLVPVRRMDFIAQDEPARALAVEVAENEKRRDYKPAEVCALAERLQAAGFRATPGRPRKGTKALLPALGCIVGKSKRTLLRILNPEPAKKKPDAWTVALERLAYTLDAFACVAADTPRAKLTPGDRRAVNDAAKLQAVIERMLNHGKK